MKKIILLGIFLFLPILALASFASSRAEIIDETLKNLELANALNQAGENEAYEQNLAPAIYEPYDTKEVLAETKDENQKGQFYLSGGYNANHMHYKEIRGGNTLDEDYGKLHGFYITLGYRSNKFIEQINGKLFIEGYFRNYNNFITYDGGSAAGPLAFKERAEIQRFGIKLGAYKDFLDKGELFGYLDLGKRLWYRGDNEIIEGVLSYAEKYYWVYVGIGTGINYKPLSKVSTGIDVEFMFAPADDSAKMRADLYEGGTFKLGDVWGAELKAPIKYYLLKNLSLDLTPYFTYWRINESDIVSISGASYIEPDSRTHIEGVLAGLTWYF